MRPHLAWLTRIFSHPPPLPEWVLPVLLLALCFVGGATVGAMFCAQDRVSQSARELHSTVEQSGLVHRLQAIEHRLKVLEEGKP